MKKINLFIFAAHHSSNNIASQRFRGLVKYLDFKKYRVFIFSRPPPAGIQAPVFAENADVTVINYPGSCIGESTSGLISFVVTLMVIFPRCYRLAAKICRGSDRIWLLQAVTGAVDLCRERLNSGERCIALGTYSPFDALVAARCLSKYFKIPSVQDFRDGLTFEAMGKKGRLRSLLKLALEARIVKAADLITSVSRPIVDDFRSRYLFKNVQLLPNGYDPEDFTLNNSTGPSATDELERVFPENKQLIGHFGRISASDATRICSLECFVRSVNASTKAMHSLHAVFVGELSEQERAVIGELTCSFSIIRPVARPVALALMTKCKILLLITGDGVGCATGKLFEYLAAGPAILCFSGVINEASHILEATGAGRTVLSSEDTKGSLLLENVIASSSRNNGRQRLSLYDKSEQVKQFEQWLVELATGY